MSDPLTTALAIYKGGTIATKAARFVGRLGRTNTERFIAARDEMHREWTAETAGVLAAHVEESRTRFIALGGSVEEHGRLLDELLEQNEVHVLGALYGDAAYREVIAERRRMLSFAAASIVDLTLSIEEKAGVERVIRALDPRDVLELHKLSRVVGKIERLPDGTGQEHASTDAVRYALLSRSDSDDALCSAHCVRETLVPTSGGWGGAGGGAAHDVAHVTTRGALVLRILRRYLDEKHDAFVGCGRGELPGSRSEREAREAIASVDLTSALQLALSATRKLEGWAQPHFEPPQPTLAPGDRRMSRALVEPAARTIAMLRIGACPPEAARAIPSPPEGSEFGIKLEDLPGYGRPATNVVVRAPYDVLRWLADDLEARWS